MCQVQVTCLTGRDRYQGFKVVISELVEEQVKAAHLRQHCPAVFSCLEVLQQVFCFFLPCSISRDYSRSCSFYRGHLVSDVGSTKHDVDCLTSQTAPCILVQLRKPKVSNGCVYQLFR